MCTSIIEIARAEGMAKRGDEWFPLTQAVVAYDHARHAPLADVITLDRNYRSTQLILAAANGVIDLAAERFTKNLWTERQSAERPQLVSVRDEADQARYIVERVLENREVGTSLKQQAVLFRTSHHAQRARRRRAACWRCRP